LLLTMEEGLKFEGVKAKLDLRTIFRTLLEVPRYWVTIVRSALIGCWMGITPGGPTAASFMSYALGRRFSRRGKHFGKGEPEGIVSPETADHSAGSCALLPMLALGIPGSATAAVMMGGLMIWGLSPGPMLFTTRPDFVWGLIASMYMGNIIAVVLVLATVPLFATILRAPFTVVGPMITVVCVIGAYTVASHTFDIWLALGFGIAGYVFKKLDYPLAPFVLAMVLGDKAEDAFRQAMLTSDGSASIFFSNGLVATMMGIGIFLLLLPAVSAIAGGSLLGGRKAEAA
jgi:TctA family transporter